MGCGLQKWVVPAKEWGQVPVVVRGCHRASRFGTVQGARRPRLGFPGPCGQCPSLGPESPCASRLGGSEGSGDTG